MLKHRSRRWSDRGIALACAGVVASFGAGQQPSEDRPKWQAPKPVSIPPGVKERFEESKAPDVAATRLAQLQKQMKPDYRFTIGATSVLSRPGGPLRGFRSGRDRRLVVKAPEHQVAAMMAVPGSLDYVAMGRVTPVKGQYCRDCWAFAAAAICESAYIKNHSGAWPDFSEQCLVNCVGPESGCNGGYLDSALDYVLRSGITDEGVYAYTGWAAQCNMGDRALFKAASWGFVKTDDPFGVATDAQLKQALLEHGPLAVGICWSDLADAYQSGVLNNCADASGPADHAVTLVGWNDDYGAWRIKNSEGTGWGDQGFAWVEYGCANIGTMAVWVEME